MISVTELRAGRAFRDGDNVYQVLEYKHTKMGRGNATIRVKAKNILTGSIIDKSFVSGSKVEDIDLLSRSMQYLYSDKDEVYFMDPTTFEQIKLDRALIEEQIKFFKEGMTVKVCFYEENPFSVELPNSMVFKVGSAPPGVKGDSASPGNKPVVLENGLTVQVPLFIKKGDEVKIDTRTGSYVSRVN
ncbi:MAG: elongation factor P [Patescibacteria group bacterium]|nr:elongation factor P [Patescibacteria group bacterium]